LTAKRFENGTRFCKVLSHNGTVYLAGMTADDTTGDVIQQTRDTLAKIDHYLTMAGSNKSKLLTAVIWLRDIADFDRMNSVWDEWIDPSSMPVRATVEARMAGDSYRVEIMVTAEE
jgi:enamine deaminase RidA (YjgF/YER057c/UK114 family)